MARCFPLTAFQVFLSLFVVLKRPSEILVLLVNLGYGILINLIISFPSSLTSQHYFLQYYKSFVLTCLLTVKLNQFQTCFHNLLIIFENMTSNNGLKNNYKQRLKLTLIHICNCLKRLQDKIHTYIYIYYIYYIYKTKYA